MKNNVLLKGTLITLIAAGGFGAAAPVAKIIYGYGITPHFMLAARFLVASVFLWMYIFIKRKQMNCKIDKQQLMTMFFIGGFVYFFTTTFYFNAIKFIPVSLHVIIFYTYPFMVNIFSFVFFKEKFSFSQVIALFVAFGGILLIVSVSNSEIKAIGILLSILAAIFNGTYILLLGIKKIKNVNSIITAAYTNTFSAISFIIYCLFKSEIYFDISYKGWLGVGFIAIVSTVVAIIALSAGIKMIGPSRASIISTFEPLEGVVLSIIFLGEQLFFKQILGMILILFSIIIINVTVNCHNNESNDLN